MGWHLDGSNCSESMLFSVKKRSVSVRCEFSDGSALFKVRQWKQATGSQSAEGASCGF